MSLICFVNTHYSYTTRDQSTVGSVRLLKLSGDYSMAIDDYNEKEIDDLVSIQEFVRTIATQKKEMVLTSKGKTVGAILTAEQYDWFLDQIDAQQDLSFVAERLSDTSGSQSLADFKRELNDE